MSTTTKNDLIQQVLQLSRQANTDALVFQQSVAESLHIHITDLKALLILAYESPLTAGDLGEKLGVSPGAVTGVTGRLERAGLAKKVIDPHDKRKVSIKLDAEGAQQAQAIYEKIGKETVELLDTYSEAELRVLISYFRKSFSLTQDHPFNHAMKKD